MDVVTFVRARLDEDERMARAAVEAAGGAVWRADDGGIFPEDNPSMHPGAFLADVYGFTDPGYGDHIARHDPARVLREVAFNRRQLDAHQPRPLVDPDGNERPDWPERECRRCGGSWMGTPDWARGDDFVPPEPEYCDELRHLATVWADHPDFREDWRP